MRHSILLVDDDPLILSSLSEALEGEGYRVTCSVNGQAAVDLMKACTFDLIITDMVMEEVDGIEVLKKAKAEYPEIKVIILTGYGNMETAIETLRLEVDDYLLKPIEAGEVFSRVRICLDKLESQRKIKKAYSETEKRSKARNNEIAAVCEHLKKELKEKKDIDKIIKGSEKRYGILREGCCDIIYFLNPAGCFSFVGNSIESILGYKVKHLLGKHYSSIVWPEDQEKAKYHFNERRNGDRYTKEFELRLGMGVEQSGQSTIDYLPVELHSFGIYREPVSETDKTFSGTLGIARDVCMWNHAENSLKFLNEELDKERKLKKLLSKKFIDTLESDRKEMAMELHDNIGQSLTSLNMNLESIKNQIEKENNEIRNNVEMGIEKVHQTIEDLKNITYQLRPDILDNLGLLPSIKELLGRVKKSSNMEPVFFAKNIDGKFSPRKELCLYRIVQEALTNIIKHSKAKKLYLNLVEKENRIFLSIEDDGVGFDYDAERININTKNSMGLLTMRERAMQVGGSFTLDSSLNNGTHILVEIPV